nr:Ribosomal protein S11 [Polysiphonia sp.]
MKIYFFLVFFSQNNIFVTLTNFKGDVLFWKSIGSLKLKGLKKITNSNSLIKNFTLSIFKKIFHFSNFRLHIRIKGFNKIKKTFLKIFLNMVQEFIISLNDDSNVAHNGVSLKKRRRL